MNTLLAAAMTFQLAIMPTDPNSQRTMQNKNLFQPFDVRDEQGQPREFQSKSECMIFAMENLAAILTARGLPVGASGNIACTIKPQ